MLHWVKRLNVDYQTVLLGAMHVHDGRPMGFKVHMSSIKVYMIAHAIRVTGLITFDES